MMRMTEKSCQVTLLGAGGDMKSHRRRLRKKTKPRRWVQMFRVSLWRLTTDLRHCLQVWSDL